MLTPCRLGAAAMASVCEWKKEKPAQRLRFFAERGHSCRAPSSIGAPDGVPADPAAIPASLRPRATSYTGGGCILFPRSLPMLGDDALQATQTELIRRMPAIADNQPLP